MPVDLVHVHHDMLAFRNSSKNRPEYATGTGRGTTWPCIPRADTFGPVRPVWCDRPRPHETERGGGRGGKRKTPCVPRSLQEAAAALRNVAEHCMTSRSSCRAARYRCHRLRVGGGMSTEAVNREPWRITLKFSNGESCVLVGHSELVQ